MGVIMQCFYWDCPKLENQESTWWTYLQTQLASLKEVGFTSLWLPPANKAGEVTSMGYDPYDYYDLGDFDQKGGTKTWYGNKAELIELIAQAHLRGLEVYADMVLNHTNGADSEELNHYSGKLGWTKYIPLSGQFERDWTCYHPSYFERWDNGEFSGMPDLCHRNPYVFSELVEYARWLIEDIGFDGFRYDFVKGYGTWLINALLERLYTRDKKVNFSPFGVGEYWDGDASIVEWLNQTNAFSDNPVSAFDFPLRYRLKDLCDTFGFSLKTLTTPGTVMFGNATQAVTFVENHDVIRNNAIVNDKLLAYAFILTHEGYPCVFWQDYYNFNLAREGTPNGIAALVKVHELFAGGSTNVLYCDNNLYIMERTGFGTQKGLVFVLNNIAVWNGKNVATQWKNAGFLPEAWYSKNNTDTPAAKTTDNNGNGDFWAPPRGYAVYVPA